MWRPMKKLILAALLTIAILSFGSIGPSAHAVSGVDHWPISFPMAQVKSATPQPQKSPSPPTKSPATNNSVQNQNVTSPPKAGAVSPPAPAAKTPPKGQSSGPYDMEAMKAFSRSLYGS